MYNDVNVIKSEQVLKESVIRWRLFGQLRKCFAIQTKNKALAKQACWSGVRKRRVLQRTGKQRLVQSQCAENCVEEFSGVLTSYSKTKRSIDSLWLVETGIQMLTAINDREMN